MIRGTDELGRYPIDDRSLPGTGIGAIMMTGTADRAWSRFDDVSLLLPRSLSARDQDRGTTRSLAQAALVAELLDHELPQ